ncbi:hypothetical protein O181_007461 [Austropuccinia psidii MF-1]|uniref:Uncharacterized protein n=1 Tax=Austropuccinia psidii MF-1 TaxID=1389203 RepID=A0A9Q3BKV3_9BASI|nr:hypothetical protein [Austropuccinia psidii MF-1]
MHSTMLLKPEHLLLHSLIKRPQDESHPDNQEFENYKLLTVVDEAHMTNAQEGLSDVVDEVHTEHSFSDVVDEIHAEECAADMVDEAHSEEAPCPDEPTPPKCIEITGA